MRQPFAISRSCQYRIKRGLVSRIDHLPVEREGDNLPGDELAGFLQRLLRGHLKPAVFNRDTGLGESIAAAPARKSLLDVFIAQSLISNLKKEVIDKESIMVIASFLQTCRKQSRALQASSREVRLEPAGGQGCRPIAVRRGSSLAVRYGVHPPSRGVRRQGCGSLRGRRQGSTAGAPGCR